MKLEKQKLICTGCGAEYEDITKVRCKECDDILEFEKIKISKFKVKESNSIFIRFKDFFPLIENEKILYTGEGNSPHIEVEKDVFVINESVNPTYSFKDRGTLYSLMVAKKLDYKDIGTVSTGNMAASVAAYSNLFDQNAHIFVSNSISDYKLAQIQQYSPQIYKVKQNYGKLYYKSLEYGQKNKIFFSNSDVPSRVEGYKTLSFEIYEKYGKSLPEIIIIPVSAGGNFRGIVKGFIELEKSGLINKMPIFIAAQALGCSPIYNAYKNQENKIKPIENPETIAKAVSNPYPPSGNEVLRILKKYKGQSISVTDEEIIEAKQDLSKKALLFQPAGCISYAAYKKLKKTQKIGNNVKVLCIATGSGLKVKQELEKKVIKIIDNL